MARVIVGSGAFGRFKREIRARGLEKDWHAFRLAAIRQIAGLFLVENRIAFRED